MKKLKSSFIAKLIAGVLLAAFIEVAMLLGIMTVGFYMDCGFMPNGKDEAVKTIVSQIAWGYGDDIDTYYTAVIEDNKAVKRNQSKAFDKENCNMSFTVEPLNNDSLPVLNNYKLDENNIQYEESYLTCVNYDYTSRQFRAHVSGDFIYSVLGVENEYGYTESSDDTNDIYIADSSNYYNDIYITDDVDKLGCYVSYGDKTYYFDKSMAFMKEFEKFRTEIENEYSSIDYSTWYDSETQEVVVDCWCGHSVDVMVTMSVAKNLKARDRFSTSWTLNLIKTFYGISIPLVSISVIMAFVLCVFLVFAAGHRKESEEINIGWFDKIPYDIILAVPFFISVSLISMDRYSYGYYYRQWIILFVLTFLVMLFPLWLTTTSVRAKTGSVLKNTVIWRLLKLIGKGIKFVFSKMGYGITYLARNMSILWKYLFAFIGITLVDIFVVILAVNSNTYSLLLILLGGRAVILGLLLKIVVDMNKIKRGGEALASGNVSGEIKTEDMFWEYKKHGENLNQISDGIKKAVDERMKSEHMKTELITNVSHDIKTPLTSIINYVDLLEKENIEGEKAREYLEVLDRQSARLKKLIEDLIEASRASTGNMKVKLETIDFSVMLEQAEGEFEDKLAKRGLKLVKNNTAKNSNVLADGKLLWRVISNLIGNVSKYAEDNSRVYIDVNNIHNSDETEKLTMTIKNISKEELNISGEELMERFVRGDSSRNTEGSGLGLSIAKSLMELQGGSLDITVDGDLFKVMITFNTTE